MHRPGRGDQANQRREDHEEHDPRFQQRGIVGDVTAWGGVELAWDRVDSGVGHQPIHSNASQPTCLYLIRGRVSNVWNGGGEGSVHSKVVAPGPQGLAAAFSLRENWA